MGYGADRKGSTYTVQDKVPFCLDRKISQRLVEGRDKIRRASEDTGRDRGTIRICNRYGGDRWGSCAFILWGGTEAFASRDYASIEEPERQGNVGAGAWATERVVGSRTLGRWILCWDSGRWSDRGKHKEVHRKAGKRGRTQSI